MLYTKRIENRQLGAGKIGAAVYRERFSGRVAAIYHNNMRMFDSKKFMLAQKSSFKRVIRPESIVEFQVLYDRSEELYLGRAKRRGPSRSGILFYLRTKYLIP